MSYYPYKTLHLCRRYAPDAIHIDFTLISLPDPVIRVNDTIVVWERDEKIS
jgi:hypothetical protein